MRCAEELGKAKRLRQRSTSADEPPKKSVKGGSDERLPFAGEDSLVAVKLNSWFGPTLARVKEELIQNGGSGLGNQGSANHSAAAPKSSAATALYRRERSAQPSSSISRPDNEGHHASTNADTRRLFDEHPQPRKVAMSPVADGPAMRPTVLRFGSRAPKSGGQCSRHFNGHDNGGRVVITPPSEAASKAEFPVQEVTRSTSVEQDIPKFKSSGEQSVLDRVLNERLQHFHARWRAAQQILDEIGARFAPPRRQTAMPAIVAYRQWPWHNSQRHKRAASESLEQPAPRQPREPDSGSQSPVEEHTVPPTSFDAEFKRPYPVSKESTVRLQHRTAAADERAVIATKAAASSEERESDGSESPPEGEAPYSHYLVSLSTFVHQRQPVLFPQVESFLHSVLDVHRTISEEPVEVLDALCTQSERVCCWLLAYQDTMNRMMAPYEVEVVEVHPGSYTMRHLGDTFPKQATAESIREKAQGMCIGDKQFVHERECLVTWMLRVHCCIQRLHLDLTAVAGSPGEFCRRFRLHEGYRVVELGVSGTASPRSRFLFPFLGHVSRLTELSLFGLYLLLPEDNFRLAALVASNVLLRKLSLKRCHIADSNLAGLIDAAVGLPLLECFSLSLCNAGLWFKRSQQLALLLASSGSERLRQVQFGVACDLKPILENLRENKNVVEVHISHELVAPSELMKLCDLAEANTSLRRLVLSVDLESALPSRYYQFILTKFIENAKMEHLMLSNSFFTTRGVQAIAGGLKKNGIQKRACLPFEEPPTMNDEREPRFLKALYLRSSNLTCEHLSILVEALNANDTLEVLDVGKVQSSPSVSHTDVTQKIIDNAIWQNQRKTVSQQNFSAPIVRVNKVHFAEEIPLLISAIRKDVTFRKLNLAFCDVPGESLGSRSLQFSHLVAMLPFYRASDALESLEIDVHLPGIRNHSFLGLSLLAASSKTLTELSISLADTCCEFTSILLLQGLASSVSIRSLMMSGWGLKHPVSVWFWNFCRLNQSLQKLHIHVTSTQDEGSAGFLDDLPDTIEECRWLVDFRLTHGKLREPIVLPEVLSIVRKNQQLHPVAVTQTITAAMEPHRVIQTFEKKLTVDIGVRLRRSLDKTGFKEALVERTNWYTEKIDKAIKFTKALISRTLGQRAKVQRRDSSLGPNLKAKVRGPFGDLDEITQERIFRRLQVHNACTLDCSDIYVAEYQMRLSEVSHAMRTIYNEEHQYYASVCNKLQQLFLGIVDMTSL